MTTGDILSDATVALAFLGGVMLLLVAGGAIFENTSWGRRFADHVIRRFF